MFRKALFSSVLLIGLSVLAAQATPIEIENPSFELPGTSKQTNFTNVPGWSTDTVAADSGVETGYTPTDGTWTAFLRGEATDPSIWQLTNHEIVRGDVFELKVDARSTSAATTLRMTLYYDDNGVRTVAATQDVTITDTMTAYTLSLDSTTVPASAGHKIGVEFANVTGSGTWLGLDLVRLELIKAGSTGGALSPLPADMATDVYRDAVLAWTPGPWADTHNVYFGVSFADVNDADVANPLGVLASEGQDANTFDPGRLEIGQTYYWRIDEVNAPPISTVFKGDVWSFTVEPYSYAIAGGRITATASSSNAATTGPDKTIDGSGLNDSDQHSMDLDDMWLSAKGGPKPVWIQYEFDRLCALDRVIVWNSNQTLEAMIGLGARNVTVEHSADGVAWTTLGDFEFAQADGTETYVANTTVEFGEVAAKYVRLTIQDNWGGLSPQCSLSEVRFYAVPLAGREPVPASGATDVAPNVTLSWRAGRNAASHRVCLSTNQQAVIDGTAPTTVTSEPSYEVVVDLAATYFWKVVEVNEAESPASWEGEVWSFSTADSIVIDDFESYTDDDGNAIFDFWIDGWQVETNGSLVGYEDSPFAEQTIIHGGAQSMPLAYENTTGTMTSEAVLTFDDAQDWTRAGVTTLSLYFRGTVGNTTSMPLWVEVADQSNKSVKVTFGDAGEDATALADAAWTEWNIPLGSLSGLNLARVESITIGLGPGLGSGMLFIDDIQLYPKREVVTPSEAVLVGHWKLDSNAQDSSGNGNNGALTGNPTFATAGRIGTALILDGIDDYVNCGNGATLNITDAVTLSAWIKPDDAANSEHNPFVAKGDTSYALKHNTTNTIEFFIYDGAWYAVNSETLTTDFSGAWHHVAGTYDGVQLKLFVDGVLVGSNLHTGDIDSVTYDVNIGRDSQNTDRFYDGQIDDVRIYHGALPKSEILKLANP
ncbi:MAG: LamG-like jellyroll fold domain-containing protein [Phycisphaerales bacterium]